MADQNQATTDDESSTEPQHGDRVLLRHRDADVLGEVGDLIDSYQGAHSTQYRIRLEDDREYTVDRDQFVTASDLELLDRVKAIDDDMVEALEQVKELLGGGDA